MTTVVIRLPIIERNEKVGINHPSNICIGSLDDSSDCVLSVLVGELKVGSIHDRRPEHTSGGKGSSLYSGEVIVSTGFSMVD
jgi:hypothetical protein